MSQIKCRKCGGLNIKKIRSRLNKDGVSIFYNCCIDCRRIRYKKWLLKNPEYHKLYKEKNQDRLKIYYRKYEQSHKIEKKNYRILNSDKLRLFHRAYKKKHKDYYRELNKKWALVNRDKVNSYIKNWKLKHPAHCNYLLYLNRAMRANASADTDINKKFLINLKKAVGENCPYCNKPVTKWSLDHKTPLSRGGTHTKDNVMYCCALCNSKKYTKTLEEFLGAKSTSIVLANTISDVP